MSLTRPRIIVQVEPDGRSNWSDLMATLARTLKPERASPGAALSFSEIRIERRHHRGHRRRRAGSPRAVQTSNWRSPGRRSRAASPRPAASSGAASRSTRARTPTDLLAALVRRPLGPEASARRRAVQARLRRPHEPAADAEDRRHARGRRQVAARHAALGRPAAAAGRRLRPLRAQGADQRHRRQRSRSPPSISSSTATSPKACSPSPPTAAQTLQGHARRRRARSHALSFHRPLLRANERDWSRVPLALDGLTDFDLDLRLSAARVTRRHAPSSAAPPSPPTCAPAASPWRSASRRPSAASLKGALVLAKDGDGADLKSQLQFTDVDLEACLGELFGIRRLEGKRQSRRSRSRPPATACWR